MLPEVNFWYTYPMKWLKLILLKFPFVLQLFAQVYDHLITLMFIVQFCPILTHLLPVQF